MLAAKPFNWGYALQESPCAVVKLTLEAMR